MVWLFGRAVDGNVNDPDAGICGTDSVVDTVWPRLSVAVITTTLDEPGVISNENVHRPVVALKLTDCAAPPFKVYFSVLIEAGVPANDAPSEAATVPLNTIGTPADIVDGEKLAVNDGSGLTTGTEEVPFAATPS